MASLPIHAIDMRKPAGERWAAIARLRGPIQELTHQYVRDLGGLGPHRALLEAFRDAALRDEYIEEIEAIASYAQLDPLAVLLGNVYYDAFKLAMGCTAFALEGAEGPLHARNLDWWTEQGALRRHSCVFQWIGGRTPVEVVSWPGFIGSFSGVARGRFTLTLNAVLSSEPAQITAPISLQLREVLLEARDYDEAVATLSGATLPADCLLLLTGIDNQQMCVIERTPTRAALRGPERGVIVATNDYRSLAEEEGRGGGELARTAGGRFEVCGGRARDERPGDVASCMAILNDHGIRMGITVQQMVLSARRGLLEAC